MKLANTSVTNELAKKAKSATAKALNTRNIGEDVKPMRSAKKETRLPIMPSRARVPVIQLARMQSKKSDQSASSVDPLLVVMVTGSNNEVPLSVGILLVNFTGTWLYVVIRGYTTLV